MQGTGHRRSIFPAALIAFAMFANTGPARASASLTCTIDDKTAKLDVQASVSRGAGEGVFNLTGEFSTTLRGAPDDLKKLAFEKEHLTQSWLHGRDIKLRLYRERGEKEPHGYVELIIATRRAGNDEDAPYNGTYELIVHFIPPPDGSDGKTLKGRGKVKCEVG